MSLCLYIFQMHPFTKRLHSRLNLTQVGFFPGRPGALRRGGPAAHRGSAVSVSTDGCRSRQWRVAGATSGVFQLSSVRRKGGHRIRKVQVRTTCCEDYGIERMFWEGAGCQHSCSWLPQDFWPLAISSGSPIIKVNVSVNGQLLLILFQPGKTVGAALALLRACPARRAHRAPSHRHLVHRSAPP